MQKQCIYKLSISGSKSRALEINRSIEQLLETILYFQNSSDLLHDVACKWLTSDDLWQRKPNWKRWIQERSTKKKLTIAGILPLTGSRYRAPELMPVIQMAIGDIEKDTSILSNYELTPVINDGQCKSDEVMNGVLEVIMNQEFKKSFVGILGKITIRQCLT